MKKCQQLWTKYHHAVPLILYAIIYLSWFSYLEQTVKPPYRIIHLAVDDYIPFLEIFVVPYFLWFVYVAAAVLLLFFTDKAEYYRSCTFLFTGMTIFLIISTIWPNGHQLRPLVMPRENCFTDMILGLWKTDTPTNLWPSIHVYNSIGAHLAITHSKALENKKMVKIASLILAISIIFSTMFIKQHSVFDVLTAFAMSIVMYVAVYRTDLVSAIHSAVKRRKRKPQIVQ